MEKARKDELELDFEIEVLEDRVAPSVTLGLAFLIRAGSERLLVRSDASAYTGIRRSPVAEIISKPE